MLISLKFSDRWYFVAATSLKEAGKLLESKVYDTLQLQVNMCLLCLYIIAVNFIVFVIFIRFNLFNGILHGHFWSSNVKVENVICLFCLAMK